MRPNESGSVWINVRSELLMRLSRIFGSCLWYKQLTRTSYSELTVIQIFSLFVEPPCIIQELGNSAVRPGKNYGIYHKR